MNTDGDIPVDDDDAILYREVPRRLGIGKYFLVCTRSQKHPFQLFSQPAFAKDRIFTLHNYKQMHTNYVRGLVFAKKAGIRHFRKETFLSVHLEAFFENAIYMRQKV